MMRFMKRLLRLGMTMLLLLSLTAATALAAAETATVTVNVTNTPVRGDVLLEKTGLQLVRFEDEQDACGNTVMRPVFQNGYLAGAVFELRAAEDIVGKEGSVFYRKDELIETLTTSKTGSVKSRCCRWASIPSRKSPRRTVMCLIARLIPSRWLPWISRPRLSRSRCLPATLICRCA